jgi:hypothetical protein
MTSHDDEIAVSVLTLWAEIGAQMSDFRRYLREKRAILGTAPEISSDIECAIRATGPVLSVWVEADVGDGEALTWWSDVSARDDDWLFEASLMWNGRDPILELTEKSFEDFRSVRQALPSLIEELFDSGRQIFEDAVEQVRSRQT